MGLLTLLSSMAFCRVPCLLGISSESAFFWLGAKRIVPFTRASRLDFRTFLTGTYHVIWDQIRKWYSERHDPHLILQVPPLLHEMFDGVLTGSSE